MGLAEYGEARGICRRGLENMQSIVYIEWHTVAAPALQAW